MNDDDDTKWHLDKKVPVAIIVTITIQTAAMIWWAATLSQRVDYLERRENATAPHIERIIRLEARVEGMADNIVEIRNILRRREERN